MVSEQDKTTKNQRKDEIVNYLISHPYKEEKEVLKYCLEKGIGSKVTVNHAIRELLKEDILDPGKERKNSKSYKLTVKSNNLLLTIPKDLEEIFEQFKIFIDKVKELDRKNKFTTQNDSSGIEEETSIASHLSFLQYDIIEIINDVYLFYFVIVLPNQLDNENLIAKLYSLYFRKVSEMYFYIVSDIHAKKDSNFNKDQHFNLYENFVDSKELSLKNRLIEVVKISEKSNIGADLDRLLKLLWTKNKVAFLLLYERVKTPEAKLLLNNKDRKLDTITKHDIDNKIGEFLLDIKTDMDTFVQRTDGVSLPEDKDVR